jgi:hypothetical protein
VAQISEFSIVFVAMGITLGHVGVEALGLTTLVGVVTIALSTYMILYSHPLYERWRPGWACSSADEAREEKTRLVEQAHRHGEHELREHVGRRDDRGHHEGADDHVGPRLAQLLHAHHAEAHQHHHHDRDLEGDAEGEEHGDDEAEVGLDVGRGRDRLRRELVDEGEHLAEHEEVAERDAEEKSTVLATTSGSTSFFSCSYRPGATNAQAW